MLGDSDSISVETGCSPCSSTTSEINRSIATNIFCSFDILVPSISLLSDSIAATHIQMYSDPNLITVPSFCMQEYSEIFFF
jgi:hypothetical protein